MSLVSLANLVYGIICIALGAEAAVRVKSYASLAGGGGLGLLAIIAALVGRTHPKIGLALGLLAGVAALGRFFPAYLKKHEVYPSLTIMIITVIFILVLLYGYFAAAKHPS